MPRGDPEIMTRDLKLQDLRVRLQKAVADEAFEAAATLRDEIRGLE
jgi:protein-arginine kinase activator protein McsA